MDTSSGTLIILGLSNAMVRCFQKSTRALRLPPKSSLIVTNDKTVALSREDTSTIKYPTTPERTRSLGILLGYQAERRSARRPIRFNFVYPRPAHRRTV